MKSILRFIQIAPPERNLFLKTYVLLTFVRLGLVWRSFNRLRSLLERISSPKQAAAIAPTDPLSQRQLVARVQWAVNACCKFMPGSVKCLARALTMKTLLDQYGCPSKLMIGVDKNSVDQLEAHAWIEYEGHVVMGQLNDLSRFKPLPNLPQPLRARPAELLD
jgi:Transglutaminase-like superfamily